MNTASQTANLFRIGAADGALDRKYLRVCSVYRLLCRGLIGKDRALELLAQRHNPLEMKSLRSTVELWLASNWLRDAIANAEA